MTFKSTGTPGVIAIEKNGFPLSAVAVESAIPVFIGYTQKAERNNISLLRKPTRISSLVEYKTFFGEGVKTRFTISGTDPGTSSQMLLINGRQYFVSPNADELSYFYPGIRMFFANGGGPCYILSVGTFGGEGQHTVAVNLQDFTGAETANSVIDILEKEAEPAMILFPDLIMLGVTAYSFYDTILQHCEKMQNRIGIFDLRKQMPGEKTADLLQEFREKTGNGALSYGAAFFPWLNATIVEEEEVDFTNLDPSVDLSVLLPEPGLNEFNIKLHDQSDAAGVKQSNLSLKSASPTYRLILEKIRFLLNELPPSSAIAGVIATVDNTRGVWKAPANISVQSVNSLTVNLNEAEQEMMNVDVLAGKSVNSIRAFPGEGVLVWGARTLDGNSNDWRYISVRRTMIMIEQSLKLAIRALVFEPNNHTTWEAVKSMSSNFLINLWRQGALQGTTPGQAFAVDCGLGSTMTADDILLGILRVTIKVAITHPAEFIVITFQQQMENRD